ncbi:LPXTG cell wall anchor domain-containing protein [Microbacterium dextranolyticum]|uniref:LPXTG cell wall anchor domain-containing protein n=1 Tax=Microbacterium dextranolyticum TaxID=36806 RepID=A0A9W6M7J9_9MICO|nr:LPXTG cell wall anchor domain-containing protein [Microbacterium dextranolyticum]MBM7464052.1 LPXTG-motif cell wall-anchored protein [Microbacterium dextranolyticum]GLJ96618.1 hypothetical protein GCM10017591_26810 [Microbacterium dextranolyticum]
MTWLTAAADTTEYNSEGVRVFVDILPVPCGTGCSGALPVTGGEPAWMLLAAGAALVIAGVAVVRGYHGSRRNGVG